MPVPASQYSVNYFPINNGGYEMWSSYDGQQYQADMKVAKSLGFNTLRVILAAKNGYFDFSALTAAELVQLTDFYSRAKSTGIALHLTLFALLRQVAGLVADLPEILRPGQRAPHRHRQHEHQGEPATPPARVRHLREHVQQARDLLISTGHSADQGMRDWHGWPLVPEDDRASGTLIIPGTGGHHRKSGARYHTPARHVKAGSVTTSRDTIWANAALGPPRRGIASTP
jgi:hypothetical protein